MATKATFTLSSTGLVSDNMNFSTDATLTQAGGAVDIANTSGLARKTTASTAQYTLFKADEYTSDRSNKLYLKNTSSTAAEYFTVSIDDETIGRLYAGDWALIPWSATGGTPAAFSVTFASSWAENDTAVFDGVTITLGSTETTAAMVDLVVAAQYPNWTVVETSSTVATFTAKDSNDLSLIEEGAASDDYVVTTAGSGTGTVARTVAPVASANDIKITPGQSANTVEYMLFHE
jgi:hypothetical protein